MEAVGIIKSTFGLFYSHLVYFMDIWYSFVVIKNILPVLVCCTKKNLATLEQEREKVASLCSNNWSVKICIILDISGTVHFSSDTNDLEEKIRGFLGKKVASSLSLSLSLYLSFFFFLTLYLSSSFLLSIFLLLSYSIFLYLSHSLASSFLLYLSLSLFFICLSIFLSLSLSLFYRNNNFNAFRMINVD
jgi:hypothetical protein